MSVKPGIYIPNRLYGVLLGTGLTDSLLPAVRTADDLSRVTAMVQAIDLEKREVTLKGPLGKIGVVVASDQVTRLEHICVGDQVDAEYFVGVAAELREPTDAEIRDAFIFRGPAEPSDKGVSTPAAAARVVRVVTTVVGLDRAAQTIKLKDPMGRHLTIRVSKRRMLDTPRFNDPVVVICAEMIAISIQKTGTQS